MCACVKHLPSAALSCLTQAHKNPISSQRGDRKGDACTNTAATHTQYTAPIGRYYSKHLQSSMKPKNCLRRERRLTNVCMASLQLSTLSSTSTFQVHRFLRSFNSSFTPSLSSSKWFHVLSEWPSLSLSPLLPLLLLFSSRLLLARPPSLSLHSFLPSLCLLSSQQRVSHRALDAV